MNSSCCQARCAHQAGALIHGRPALAGGEHVSDVTNWAGRIPAAALARRIAPVGHRCRSPHSAGYRLARRSIDATASERGMPAVYLAPRRAADDLFDLARRARLYAYD